MKNCMVCGSIYGTEVQLENCIVLGGVFSSRSLTLTGCMIGTFNSPEEKPNTGKIKIDFENDTQRTVLTDDNGTQTLINSYSVASRVLVSDLIDMEKMEKLVSMNLRRTLNNLIS